MIAELRLGARQDCVNISFLPLVNYVEFAIPGVTTRWCQESALSCLYISDKKPNQKSQLGFGEIARESRPDKYGVDMDRICFVVWCNLNL